MAAERETVMSRLEKLYHRAATIAVTAPRRVLSVAVLAALGAAVLAGLRLELKTSNLDLVDRRLPPVRRFLEVAREFGTPNALIVVLEGRDPTALRQAVDRLGPRLAALPEVRSVIDRLPIDPAAVAIVGTDPYLHSRDDGLYFLFVQPMDVESRATTIAPFVAGVRRVLAEAELGLLGVEAGLTGMPEYAMNDRDVIQEDVALLSVVAFVLIGVLFAAAFSEIRRPVLAMVALGLGCLLVLGWIRFVPGHLTLLSAFFASILFGLGVDAGIHILDRLEEHLAAGEDELTALPRTLAELARPLTTSALTSASALLALVFCGFRGFAELGLIAGAGLLICLAAMVVILPALLAVTARDTRHPPRHRMGVWLARLQSRPLAVVLGMAALGALLVGGPGFDTDYLNLEPRGSEAVRLEREMVRRSDDSPEAAVFVAENRREAQDLVWRLIDDDTVGSVRSLLDFEIFGALPEMPEAFRAAFESPAGRYAIYVHPREDIWIPEHQERFVAHMQAIDPEVTGMPILGRFMVERSLRALRIAGMLGALLLMFWVLFDFRQLWPAVLAMLPAFASLATMNALMRLVELPWNPLNVMALPVVLGIAVDDGVHIVHRFRREDGDVGRTLDGTGHSIVLTTATSLAAFGVLAFSRHQGLSSFALALVLGVASALVFSVLLLPQLLQLVADRIQDRISSKAKTGRRAQLSAP